MTVRRGGRRAELYDSTSKQDLDPDEVRKVVDALGLDWRELPGQEAFSGNFGKRSPTAPG